jgi:hypothetical protein
VFEFGLQDAFALQKCGQLGTGQATCRCQDSDLVLNRPLASGSLRRHQRQRTRLLQPPRERLLPEAGLARELPGTHRIVARQARHHLLLKG